MPEQKIISYNIFQTYKNLLAFTTTKYLFKDAGARFTGDSKEFYSENRNLLAQILNINPSQLVFPVQTHTSKVVQVSEIPDKEITETDALITDVTGICLCVQTADCVPILLFDSKKKVIAAVHAGWRGTVKKITKETVVKMVAEYHSNVTDIIVTIGPSISPNVYEVGKEVEIAVRKNIPKAEKSLVKKSNRKVNLDLWEANRQLLLATGILPGNIEISGECSFCNSEKYFSARREGTNTGRMVSGIMLV